MNKHSLVARALLGLLIGSVFVPVSAFAQSPTFVMQWGTTAPGPSQLQIPVGVAVAPDGVVYVLDNGLRRIKAFTKTGALITEWPSAGNSLAVDANKVYVIGGGTFWMYSRTGALIRQRSLGGRAVAVDPSGTLFITAGDHFTRLTNTGAPLYVYGSSGTGDGQFMIADGIACDALGNIYITVATTDHARVQKFANDGTYLGQWGSPGSGSGQLNVPTRLVVCPDGSVVVADDYNCRIEAFTETGTYLWQLGSAGNVPGLFANPVGVGADADGNIYVADTNNGRIQVFSFGPTPARSATWGSLKARYR